MTLTNGRRLATVVAALALATACVAPGALAGPAADKASEAEALLGEGKAGEALSAFDEAIEAFWQGSPLQFRAVLFADAVAAFGKYEPRPNAIFRAGESVTVYLEPIGYAFVSAGGFHRVAFATGIEIRTPGGLILGATEDFGELIWSGRAKSREVHAAISVTLPQIKPGDYELLLTLTDQASKKTATVTLPFTIAG